MTQNLEALTEETIQRIGDAGERIIANLVVYEEKVRARIKQLDARESEYEKKLGQVEELKTKYETLNDQMQKRLAKQRIALSGDEHLIMPVLEELFPDNKVSSYHFSSSNDPNLSVNYKTRAYYASLLREDIGSQENVSIALALDALKLIQQKTEFTRTSAKGVREMYAGLRAFIDYVNTYEISPDDAIQRLKDTDDITDKIDKTNRSEQFLERAFSTEFDFTKYSRDLNPPPTW